MGNKRNFLKGLSASKPMFAFDFKGYSVKIYYKEDSIKGCYAEIKAHSDMMSIRVDGRTPCYGLMMQAAQEGDEATLDSYAYMCFRTMIDLATDEQFLHDMVGVLKAKSERDAELSAKKAAEVTETQEMEAQTFMESAIERGQFMGDKQYEEMASELEKEEIKAALEELAETEVGKAAEKADKEYVEPEFMKDEADVVAEENNKREDSSTDDKCEEGAKDE